MNKNVKKTALALGSALMLFSTTLKAQEQPFSFGIKAGGVASTAYGGDSEKFENEYGFGFTGGPTASFMFHENVGVGLEVLYLGQSRGTKDKTSNELFKLYSHNIAIPLMVKICPMGCDPEEGILTIDLGLQGVMQKLAVTAEISTTADKAKVEDDTTFKKDYLKPIAVNGLLGIGYEFPGLGLSADLRAHYGLLDIFKDDADAKTYKESKFGKDKTVHDAFLTFSLGYNLAGLLNG